MNGVDPTSSKTTDFLLSQQFHPQKKDPKKKFREMGNKDKADSFAQSEFNPNLLQTQWRSFKLNKTMKLDNSKLSYC